jgi:hypothetical protein
MILLLSCFDPGPLPAPPSVLATSVDGDAPVSPTAIVFARLSAPIDADSLDAVALVRGEAQGDLVAALSRPPLPTRFLGEVVSSMISVQGDTLLMMPRRALNPDARYTLVLGAALRAGGIRLGRSWLRGFTTGSLAEAAPVLSLVSPPDGAAGVVRNLRAISVAWSKPMPPAPFQLLRDDGQLWPTRTDGLVVVPEEPLDANRRWTVRADVSDAQGRAPYGDPPGFSTGDELRTQAPRLDGLLLEAADRCLVARFASDRVTSAELCVADRCQDDAASTTHALGAALSERQDGWSLRVWDESTAPEADQEGLVSPPPVPLVMTEILSEPRGPRTTQQYVELLNLGDASVDVSGLAVCTASGCDILPQGSLGSGSYAVVVGSAFGDDGLDAAPVPGTLLLRLANQRLGGRGIRAGGEPVWLQTGDGTLITRWGGWPAPLSPGQSLSRQPYNCDLPASFRPGPESPGAP